jgi:hypothetical protein
MYHFVMLLGFDALKFRDTVSATWLKCEEFDDHRYTECYKINNPTVVSPK